MSTERKALYPGSFDPPTNGHLWVMEKVSQDFDQGIVAVGHNPDKPGRFALVEREEMLREIAAEYPNLAVTSFHGIYQADFAEMVGASKIVRGIRSSDYNFENDISQVNRGINSEVETIFRIPPNNLQQVSSSMVMGLVGFEGWEQPVKLMVPVTVFDRIEKKQKEKDKESLGKRWNALHARLGTKTDTKVLFENLYKKYEESHRYYHAIPHIKTCLNELDLVRDLLESSDAVELAVWFHDSIYESNKEPSGNSQGKVDDEGSSAEFAYNLITNEMGLPHDLAENVARLILATKHTGIIETNDQAFMVDIDLAILGRSARLFDEYETKVRQEYSWVRDEDFNRARSAILETFLPPHRETIYRTPFFRDRYERQAQENLTRSIAKLK